MWKWPFAKKARPPVDLAQLAEADFEQARLVAARRILEMAAELHRRGYQGLRLCPHLSSDGGDWRCFLVPKGRMQAGSSVRFEVGRFLELEPRATFSTGDPTRPFAWTGAEAESPQQWADRFEREFAQTCAESRESDEGYAAWLTRMLADTGAVPYAWDNDREYQPMRLWGAHGSYPAHGA